MPGTDPGAARGISWRAKLVGRTAEIAHLNEELRSASSGEFRSVLMLGEPGVGKTRLAGDFLSQLPKDIAVLSARGHPLAVADSFGLWSEALERHLRGLDEEAVRGLCGGFLDDLATLFTTVAAVRGSLPDHEPPRHRVLQGLGMVLANLARRAPLVIFLDDAHEADPSSWQALHYLAHNVRDEAVLVIVAARTAELAEQSFAQGVAQSLEQEGLLERQTVSALGAEELTELAAIVLDREPPTALVTWLGERSKGNPLFALGLIQALVEEGADLAAPRLKRVPESLAERIGQRLATLPEQARSTLDLLAVIGRRMGMSELATVSELSRDSLDRSLETLGRSGWISERETGPEPAFEISHPLLQQAIYERVGTAHRRGLHRVIGRMLLAAGRLGEAAPHWARSADTGDEQAVSVLRDAIRQAENREAYREALTILGTLVELLPHGDKRWVDIVGAMSWRAEWVVDRRADVHALLGIRAMREIDSALEGSQDPLPRAAVKFRLASFLNWGTGELSEAESTCRDAADLFRLANDQRSVLLAENDLAYIRGAAGDLASFLLRAEEVLDRAERCGDRLAVLHALGSIAWGATARAEFDRAATAHDRSIKIAREDGRHYRVTWSLVMLALCRALEGRPDEGRLLLEQAKSENPRYRESVLVEWAAIVDWVRGDFGGALQHARESLAWNPEGLAKRRGLGIAFAASAAVESNERSEADAYVSKLESAYEGRDWWFFDHYRKWAVAAILRSEGKLEESGAVLLEVVEGLVAMEAWAYVAFPLLDLAEVAGERADRETARSAAATMEEVARHADRPLHRGLCALASAWSHVASAEMQAAAAMARDAVDVLSSTPCRALQARAFDALGHALAQIDRRGATDALEGAVRTFEDCGAVWRRDRALQSLRGLGGRGRRVAATIGSDSLTAREREVVSLSEQGYTAKDIAKRLFISKRTVETHLANVYAKLGVRSKRELLQRRAERGS
jgi:DNA-binding CsgD family transcriptional regulator/tetratricopeptide (TPR) repeat protein